ncbi:MAG: GrpB family protein [Hydrogenophaga sp.]|uniref:GrpB family protein n=1 Tax=Hydrogenophaga sp. TaxID=1904254 RepID=UPI001D1DBB70|nr:GrpB family protein [Hydrogenophaga sp.]MBX3609064.1 GrpB family protein [Hydrogenophaga sp.]
MRDAPISLVAPDSAWPAMFEAEQARLNEVLGEWLVGEPVHIGSTAVPGLWAKPVIDIMAPVASLAAERPAIAAAAELDYVHFPYRAELMHWFCKPSPAQRTHHLHLVPIDAPLWRERLAFRDALRANATWRGEYEALKRELAARHANDREAYTDGKTAFVQRVLRTCGV